MQAGYPAIEKSAGEGSPVEAGGRMVKHEVRGHPVARNHVLGELEGCRGAEGWAGQAR